MRKYLLLWISALYLLVSGFVYEPESEYEPIFMLRSEMERSVRLEGPREILNPGKIYLKDNFIFINEKYAGVHVIDNTDPVNPGNVAFIHIDGCIDMAVRDYVLYADNAVDMVALALNAQLTGIQVTARIKNVFPEMPAPDGYGLTYRQKQARPHNSILVRWRQK